MICHKISYFIRNLAFLWLIVENDFIFIKGKDGRLLICIRKVSHYGNALLGYGLANGKYRTGYHFILCYRFFSICIQVMYCIAKNLCIPFRIDGGFLCNRFCEIVLFAIRLICIPTGEIISGMVIRSEVFCLLTVAISFSLKLYIFLSKRIHEMNLTIWHLPSCIKYKSCRHLVVACVEIDSIGLCVPAKPGSIFYRCFRFHLGEISGDVCITRNLQGVDFVTVVIIECQRVGLCIIEEIHSQILIISGFSTQLVIARSDYFIFIIDIFPVAIVNPSAPPIIMACFYPYLVDYRSFCSGLICFIEAFVITVDFVEFRLIIQIVEFYDDGVIQTIGLAILFCGCYGTFIVLQPVTQCLCILCGEVESIYRNDVAITGNICIVGRRHSLAAYKFIFIFFGKVPSILAI